MMINENQWQKVDGSYVLNMGKGMVEFTYCKGKAFIEYRRHDSKDFFDRDRAELSLEEGIMMLTPADGSRINAFERIIAQSFDVKFASGLPRKERVVAGMVMEALLKGNYQ